MQCNEDKEVERNRYDRVALSLLDDKTKLTQLSHGYQFLPLYLQQPYKDYYSTLLDLISQNDRVLEIGAGSGQHTNILLETGAEVVATDISAQSLTLLNERLVQVGGSGLSTMVADIERLPFDDNSFDFVVCAGSLSYGEKEIVKNQVHRVLKPGGYFICVDSLNDNVIYRLNRFLHYLMKRRSSSTLRNMPDKKLISSYVDTFSYSQVSFYGSIAWLGLVLSRLTSEDFADKFIRRTDRIVGVGASAFKFVMICRR